MREAKHIVCEPRVTTAHVAELCRRARIVEKNYADGLSGLDEPQISALIALSDMTDVIIYLCNGVRP